ncbi:MAG: hypothetical protein ACOCQR_01240 [bacterium]
MRNVYEKIDFLLFYNIWSLALNNYGGDIVKEDWHFCSINVPIKFPWKKKLLDDMKENIPKTWMYIKADKQNNMIYLTNHFENGFLDCNSSIIEEKFIELFGTTENYTMQEHEKEQLIEFSAQLICILEEKLKILKEV